MPYRFYFIVLDRTRKIFSVFGPISDDTELGHRVCELQKQYDMNCYTVFTADDTKENLIKYHQKDGLSLVELKNILNY